EADRRETWNHERDSVGRSGEREAEKATEPLLIFATREAGATALNPLFHLLVQTLQGCHQGQAAAHLFLPTLALSGPAAETVSPKKSPVIRQAAKGRAGRRRNTRHRRPAASSS